MENDNEQRLMDLAAKARSGKRLNADEEAFILSCIEETLVRLDKNMKKISAAGA